MEEIQDLTDKQIQKITNYKDIIDESLSIDRPPIIDPDVELTNAIRPEILKEVDSELEIVTDLPTYREIQRRLHPPAKSMRSLFKEREDHYDGLQKQKEKESIINA